VLLEVTDGIAVQRLSLRPAGGPMFDDAFVRYLAGSAAHRRLLQGLAGADDQALLAELAQQRGGQEQHDGKTLYLALPGAQRIPAV
jgi:hypothetical protein